MKFVLPTDKTPILVQGITGSLGATHAEMAIVYGSNIVAGVAKEKGLKTFLNVPVFQTVREAVRKTKPVVSMVFSTPARALADVTEAAKEKIPLIVCTTEHVPLHDRLMMIEVAEKYGVRLLGPSSPGVVSVDKCLAGTMPAHLFPKGTIGIVSRSSSLTYEAVQQLSALNIGVSSCVALGTSTVLGTSFIPVVQSLLSDAKVKSILIIGDVNGRFEFELASWYKNQKKRKPIVVYISGKSFPKSKKLPLVGSSELTPAEKIIQKQQALEQVGAKVVYSPELIGKTVAMTIK
ncbi:MAG: succinate--CoA ligase subunit alpha [Alphaproteobacteria bacterium]|nr:succinate--CoA ligase subunit alpha [Alphaproteobacteria bacterium]